jgi:trehalose/maltose hydrolase-like predicted phosphorylase
MPDIDWNMIVETIRDESCVLFLGPGLLLTQENKTFWDEMVKELGISKNKELQYFEGDDLFFYKDSIQRTRAYFKIKKFFPG